MKTITTVTTTAKGKLPYHFICNYCGCRNDKLAEAAGVAVGGRENRGGAMLITQGTVLCVCATGLGMRLP